MKDVVVSLSVVVVFGLGGLYGYRSYAERKEAEERARAAEEADRAEASRREEEERRARAEETQRSQEEEARRRRLEEEARLRAEAERKRKAEEEAEQRRREAEEARLRAEAERVAREQEALRQERQAEEQARANKAAAATMALANWTERIQELDKQAAGIEEDVRAAKTRIAGAEREKEAAISEARQWARDQGTKAGAPWGYTSPNARMVQDNREQIMKAKARYDRAEHEIEVMRKVVDEARPKLSKIDAEKRKAEKERQKAMDTLRSLGVPFEAKPEPRRPAFVPRNKVYVLKDGRRIEAKMAMDMGDEYGIQDTEGNAHVVKKTEVTEIVDAE